MVTSSVHELNAMFKGAFTLGLGDWMTISSNDNGLNPSPTFFWQIFRAIFVILFANAIVCRVTASALHHAAQYTPTQPTMSALSRVMSQTLYSLFTRGFILTKPELVIVGRVDRLTKIILVSFTCFSVKFE